MKKNQNEFDLSFAVQLGVVDFSKTADEREVFIKKLIKKVEATIRESISNPVREDEGVTSVRSVKLINEGKLVDEYT